MISAKDTARVVKSAFIVDRRFYGLRSHVILIFTHRLSIKFRASVVSRWNLSFFQNLICILFCCHAHRIASFDHEFRFCIYKRGKRSIFVSSFWTDRQTTNTLTLCRLMEWILSILCFFASLIPQIVFYCLRWQTTLTSHNCILCLVTALDLLTFLLR